MEEYYTLGVWRAKEGREDELVETWKAIGDAFASLPDPPGTGTLLQSLDDPTLFYSFGPWPSLEAIQAMRSFEPAREAIARMQEVCEEARPGNFRVVATAGPGASG
jgi:heme-degrading monooxygenase HmoA